MTDALVIRGLCKQYPKFYLDHVTFSVPAGTVMGFVGRNGAGKSTTLKSLMDLVHPNEGEIFFFGKPFKDNEAAVKERVGYALGEVNFFPRRRIRDVAEVSKRFYTHFDEAAFTHYLSLFKLMPDKKINELSAGMKVKLNLAMALSHHADLLLLDEPTSGLDPVSRDELLEVFLALADEGISILFSTHITEDIEKCASYLTYIKEGQILFTGKTADFTHAYRILTLPENRPELRESALGICRNREGQTGLFPAAFAEGHPELAFRIPELQETMVHLEKGVSDNESFAL